MVNFLHERQQTTDLPRRKALAGKPVEIVAWQIGDQTPLIFAKGHTAGHQQEQVIGIHVAILPN